MAHNATPDSWTGREPRDDDPRLGTEPGGSPALVRSGEPQGRDDRASWRGVSAAVRVYVTVVCVAGGAIAAWSAQAIVGPQAPVLALFMAAGLVASTIKVSFPGSMSTLTVCQVLDYLALLLLGPGSAVLVAVVGGWGQCTLRSKQRPALYQTLFSVSSLAIAIQLAVLVYGWLGGRPGYFDWATSLGPFAAAAGVFFVVNAALVSAAVGMSTEQPALQLWWETCLWSWPGYLFGAAAAAALAGTETGKYWLVPVIVGGLALTFYSLRAYRDRIEDAQTDVLTGLPNQRVLLPHLEREIERARKRRTRFAVVVVDVDRFKTINDTHGHRAGDLALKQIAEGLRASLDGRDLCGRNGGDEFVVVLDGCDAAAAEVKAHQLQWAIAARRLEIRADRRVSLSVSVGTAVFPDDGCTVEQLLAAADSRMYEKKRSQSAVSRPTFSQEAV